MSSSRAGMAEQADAADLKSAAFAGVRVRTPLSAPHLTPILAPTRERADENPSLSPRAPVFRCLTSAAHARSRLIDTSTRQHVRFSCRDQLCCIPNPRDARTPGIPQTVLASQLGISRQSLHAIEAGRAIPGVDVAVRIAHALGTTVENLFPMALPTTTVDFDGPAGARASGRMALALLSGRWVAYPLGYDAAHVSADAVGTTGPDGLRLEHVRDPRESAHNVILMGCATGLGVLADRLNATTGIGRFIWMGRSSTSSLQSLAAERTHAAGVHLLDEATGIANLPDIRQSRCASPLTVIALGAWEAGYVTAPGNPRGIRSGTDLIRPGMRIAIREVGSGARRLLDRELRPSAHCPH